MKNPTNKQGRTEITQARSIQKSLGTQVAARYLAKRNWSIEATMYILLGK